MMSTVARPISPVESWIVPLTPVQRRIAAHMAGSARAVPHINTVVDVDLTEVARLCRPYADRPAGEPVLVTHLPFILKAAAESFQLRNPD